MPLTINEKTRMIIKRRLEYFKLEQEELKMNSHTQSLTIIILIYYKKKKKKL